MANQGDGELPNHLQAQPDRVIQYHHHHLLDAARALLLLGAAAAVSTVANPDGDAAQVVFLGFLTWLLGVCLTVSFVAVAARFPEAAALVGAAIANANAVLIIRHLFTPWNYY